jgi:hypothetical protein
LAKLTLAKGRIAKVPYRIDSYDVIANAWHGREGEFSTFDLALQRARDVIEEHLRAQLVIGASASKAFDHWQRNGEIPLIVPIGAVDVCDFNPSAYARARVRELALQLASRRVGLVTPRASGQAFA